MIFDRVNLDDFHRANAIFPGKRMNVDTVSSHTSFLPSVRYTTFSKCGIHESTFGQNFGVRIDLGKVGLKIKAGDE